MDNEEGKIIKGGLPLLYCLKEGFDQVEQAKMWNALRLIGMPSYLIILLSKVQNKQETTARTEFGETKRFSVGKGVKQ